MKIFRKLGLALAACLLSTGAYAIYTQPLGGSIFPLTLVTQPVTNLGDAYNEMLQLIANQVVGISTQYPGTAGLPPGGIDSSPVIYSSIVQQNPVVQTTFQDILAGSANAGIALLSPQSGRILKLAGPPTIMVSGTAAGATSVQIMCSNGVSNGKLIATYPIAMLTTNVPVMTSGGGSQVVFGSAAGRGCAVNEGIYVSNNGTLTTTTNVYVQLPYVVQ